MAAAWGGREEIVKYLLKDLQCNVNVRDVVRLKLIYKNTVLCIIANDGVYVLYVYLTVLCNRMPVVLLGNWLNNWLRAIESCPVGHQDKLPG